MSSTRATLTRSTRSALSYGSFRRYAEQKSKFDRTLGVEPNDLEAKASAHSWKWIGKADTGPLHQLIDEIRATNPAAMPKIADDAWLICALAERDVAAAKEALIASDEIPLGNDAVHFTRPFVEGIIARMTNDEHRRNWLLLLHARSRRKSSRLKPITARHGACSV